MGIMQTPVVLAAAQCLKPNRPGVMVQGALSQRVFTSATGMQEGAFIVTLVNSACLAGTGEIDEVKSTRNIHLVPKDQSVSLRLERLIGSAVIVTGKLFAGPTVHCFSPIVMEVSDVRPAPVPEAPAATPEIVEPTGDPAPSYAKAREPTARDLIETWRSFNGLVPGKRGDSEKFEIVDRRVV